MADIVTNDILKFGRGTKSQYEEGQIEETYKNYLFFTSDTHEIMMNNNAYGIHDMISDIEVIADDDTKTYALKLFYKNGSEQRTELRSLLDLVKMIVQKESFPEIESRILAVEQAVEWQEIS